MPRIAVAGPSTTVTDAAIAVCTEGGSVVDAAIVAALTAMCTEPGICGPGGGGFLTIDVPGHSPVVIDGYMSYPGLGHSGELKTRVVTMAYGGGVTTLVDAGSIAVPGAFAAFETASEMFGSVSWQTLMATVAEFVDGFPLGKAAHLYLNDGADQIYDSETASRKAFFKDGETLAVGDPITVPGLSDTLRRIGEDGAATFYRGDLGKEIVDDIGMRGSALTLRDLENYQAVVRSPKTIMLNNWTVATNPEPAVGGLVMADALVNATRDGLASALINAISRRLEAAKSPSTVSVAAADDDRGGVAASFSAGYGSGIIPAGTGLFMNNAMGELELTEGRPGTPGERMTSNMAPTVAKTLDSTVAVGSPGADRITSALTTTLARLAGGDDLESAVRHPRVHPEFGEFGVRLAVEPGADTLGADVPLRLFDDIHMYFGGVNAAGFSDGQLHAFADPRRTGSVAFTTP